MKLLPKIIITVIIIFIILYLYDLYMWNRTLKKVTTLSEPKYDAGHYKIEYTGPIKMTGVTGVSLQPGTTYTAQKNADGSFNVLIQGSYGPIGVKIPISDVKVLTTY
jgi:hypothetical protein